MALTWEETKEAMRKVNRLWNLMSEIEKKRWQSEAWMKNYETWHKYYYHMLLSKLLDKEMGTDKLWNVGVITDVMFEPYKSWVDLMFGFFTFNILRDDGEIINPVEFCYIDYKFSFHNKDFSEYTKIDGARLECVGSIDCEDIGGSGILHPDCASPCIKGKSCYGYIDVAYEQWGWHKCYMKIYIIPFTDRGKNILIYAESPARYIEFYIEKD